LTRILGLSGSLRKGSYNTALLRAACELHPQVLHIATIADIPLYNADVESAGVPAAVEALKQRVAAADGVLLASPEYNNSVPGVLKNTVDWLSRSSGAVGNVFKDKAVAVIGATPGRFGTVSAQTAWLPVWRTLGARHWSGGRLLVSGAKNVFGSDLLLSDPEIRQRLDDFVAGFLAFCDA